MSLVGTLKAAQGSSTGQSVEYDGNIFTRIGRNQAHPLRSLIGRTSEFWLGSGMFQATPSKSFHEVGVGSSTTVTVPTIIGDEALLSNADTTERFESQAGTEPLDIDDAKYLLSTYILDAVNDPAVWPLLVVASDQTGSTCFVGAKSGAEPGTLISYTISGPSASTKPEPATRLPGLDELISEFSQTQPEQSGKPVGYALAIYDILGVPHLSTSDTSSMTIEWSWRQPAAVLAPPSSSADGLLRIRGIPGGPKSSTSEVHSDLDAIGAMLGYLKAAEVSGENTASEAATLWPCNAGGGVLASRVTTFFESLSVDPNEESDGRSNEIKESASVTARGQPTIRKDMDFTERLWSFVKNANGLVDMQKALGLVLRGLQEGAAQPVVSTTNNTVIGGLARLCLGHARGATDADVGSQIRARLKSLSGVAGQLSAVVEIGIAKVRQDLRSYFLSEEFCTGAQLSYFLDGSQDPAEETERLCRLGNVMELASMTRSFADLPHNSLRGIVASALSFYQTSSSKQIPVFSVALPAFSEQSSCVRQLCINAEPSRWQYTLVGGNGSNKQDRKVTQFSINRNAFGVHEPELPPEIPEFEVDGSEPSTCFFCSDAEAIVTRVY